MPAFNKVIFIGNITKEIELRQTADGKEVVRFSIAVNRKSAKGAQNQADFFNVSAFGKTAAFVAQWFKKGDPILVEGSLHNNRYKDANGTEKFAIDVTAESVSFVSIKGEESLRKATSEIDGNVYVGGAGSGADEMPKLEEIDVDDDLPF